MLGDCDHHLNPPELAAQLKLGLTEVTASQHRLYRTDFGKEAFVEQSCPLPR